MQHTRAVDTVQWAGKSGETYEQNKNLSPSGECDYNENQPSSLRRTARALHDRHEGLDLTFGTTMQQ